MYVYVYLYLYVYVYGCECMCLHVHVCHVYVCMYVCVYVCVYVRMTWCFAAATPLKLFDVVATPRSARL